MFGIGGSEIIVILIIALLFLGPDKLPQAAKQISKGIRDIKKQSRALATQIENDEQFGGAIRDIKSALRGEEAPKPYKPPVRKALDVPVENSILGAAAAGLSEAGTDGPKPDTAAGEVAAEAAASEGTAAAASEGTAAAAAASAGNEGSDGNAGKVDDGWDSKPIAKLTDVPPLSEVSKLTLPDAAGETDGEASPTAADDDLAAVIKPAAGTVAKGS